MNRNLAALRARVAALDSVAVALSGGVDSALLLAVCLGQLGRERVLALTAAGELFPAEEQEAAAETAQRLGARHQVIRLQPLQQPAIAGNPPDRCYHCKKWLFAELQAQAARAGFGPLLHGANADDLKDYRPGLRAAEELGVRAPLLEEGLGKRQIRALARRLRLPAWRRPSQACLASRIPFGTPLTAEALARVQAAERILRRLLPANIEIRVRDRYPLACLEITAGRLPALLGEATRDRALRELRGLGYRTVALDLAGYRSGSLNEGRP
jgi:uncharacterized protein